MSNHLTKVKYTNSYFGISNYSFKLILKIIEQYFNFQIKYYVILKRFGFMHPCKCFLTLWYVLSIVNYFY